MVYLLCPSSQKFLFVGRNKGYVIAESVMQKPMKRGQDRVTGRQAPAGGHDEWLENASDVDDNDNDGNLTMCQELARFDPLREGGRYIPLPASLTSVTGISTQIKKIVEGGKADVLLRH
jgi:hypothetical protein